MATLYSAAASYRAPFPIRSPRGPSQRGIRTAQPKRGTDKKPLPLSKGGDRGEGMSILLSFAKGKPPPPQMLRGIGHAILAAASYRAPFPLRSPRGPSQRGIRTAQPKRGTDKKPLPLTKGGDRGEGMSILLSRQSEASHTTANIERDWPRYTPLPRRTARPFPCARRGALPKRDLNGAAEAGHLNKYKYILPRNPRI